MLRFHKKDVPTFIMPEFPALTKPEPETTEYLTFEEQQNILAVIPERHRSIFIIMMEYGCRPQEERLKCVIASLKIKSFFEDRIANTN